MYSWSAEPESLLKPAHGEAVRLTCTDGAKTGPQTEENGENGRAAPLVQFFFWYQIQIVMGKRRATSAPSAVQAEQQSGSESAADSSDSDVAAVQPLPKAKRPGRSKTKAS